jgi:AAA+ ATPase superfamily predicted ATPase
MAIFAGFHPKFNEFEYPPDIRVALRRLSEYFYISRSFKPINVGNSTYYGALIRPTSDTSVFINTERELLTVFSKYQTFEIRTLDAFSEFYQLVDESRIDPNLRFLITGGEGVEDGIRHYLAQNPEYPIVVPITLSKLTTAHGDPLLAAVRKNFLIRDLFAYQAPLRQELFFFGRDAIVNAVLDYARSGQNSSLFGLRKSGKTSTIYAISRRSKAAGVVTVAIDCQDPTVHARNYSELLFYILNLVRRSCGQKQIKEFPHLSLPNMSEYFAQTMRSTLGSMKSPVLLIFDEIENISPGTAASPHWTNDKDALYFWQILRSFCQSQDQNRLSLCIVGTSPVLLESARIHGVDNPMYLFAQKTFIPNLTFSETSEMVTRLGYFMGLNFPAQVVSKLYSDYGGHPFFIRQVCSRVHHLSKLYRPIEVSMRALERAQLDFNGQMESYVRAILENLQNLYPDEFSVLASLVQGDRAEFDEYMHEAPDLVDHLLGYGLVARRGDDYDITFRAISSAVKGMLPQVESGSRWATLAERRGRLEQSIRSHLYMWSRGQSATLWQEVLRIGLTNARYNDLQSLEPRLLFSSSESPLYFSDLIGLLRDARVLPHIASERARVLSALNIINKMRKDAHALDINDADWAEVKLALECAEDEFLMP